MKHLLIALCLTFALQAAEPPKSAPKPPAGVPAGAEPAGDYRWRHKDAAGKTWIYVQTPFGFNRMEEKPGGDAAEQSRSKEKAASPAFRVASVKDGLVTFERDTPFGKSKWTRKRTELGADEQAALSAFEEASQPARKQ